MNARRAGLLLGLLAWLPTAAMPAEAPAFLQRQQAQYAAQRQQWQRVELPAQVARPDRPVDAYDSGVADVWARLHDVDLYFERAVGFHALDVTARLMPARAGAPVDLNRPDQFSIAVEHGCARLSPAELSALFNQHILDYTPRPLDDLKITTADGQLVIDGRIKLWSWFPGFWMPLHLRGPLSLAENGDLVYRPQRIDALHIRAHDALHVAHLGLDQLLSIDRPGVTVSDDEIRLDVSRVFPPPHIVTKPTTLKTGADGVTLCFNRHPAITLQPPPQAGASYIWIQAGDLAALDKLLVNAHVLVRPAGARTLAFSIPDYKSDIARGRLGMTADGTLHIAIPPARLTADRR